MKPVFAKAKMGFVETAEKGTFSDREVGSEQKTSGNRISGRIFAKRTVPLTKKSYGHTLTGRVRFFDCDTEIHETRFCGKRGKISLTYCKKAFSVI